MTDFSSAKQLSVIVGPETDLPDIDVDDANIMQDARVSQLREFFIVNCFSFE
jgi:hypothetical protein